MIVHTPLLQRRALDFGAAEQDLLVHFQLRGSALERPGGLHGHRHGDDRRVGRHFLLFTATRFLVAYAIHAHRRLRPGEEVTVHYGDGYEWVRRRKGYEAGSAVVVDRGSIAADERPAAHLGRRVPRTAVAKRR